MSHLLLAVDQGTTGSTSLIVTPEGRILGRGYEEHPQHFPQPGWVEHDPLEIWATVCRATELALAEAGATPRDIAAVGITNQRETVLAWDALTSLPLGPTIVWQDRRTARRCTDLERCMATDLMADDAAADDARTATRYIREITGLPTDPYFSATKIEWLLQHDQDVQRAAHQGVLRFGTIDTWLVWRMSGGRSYVTDASNASRTMLYDIHAGCWSAQLCDTFGIDMEWLPATGNSCGLLAETDPDEFCGITAPICGIAGDQQAALFGQLCTHPGQAKATYGTGAFVLVNSGAAAPITEQLLSTVAWQKDGKITYALEGAVFTAGANVQWLRDGLRIIDAASEIEQLARSVPDSGGVVLIPAFAGLGAPHWDPHARGALLGLTRGTTRAHIARATLEGTAFRVAEVVDAMRSEGTPVTELRVDGGMARNDLLLQMQANVLGIPVLRPEQIESTSLGAAFLAAIGSGMIGSIDELAGSWRVDRTFEPETDNTALRDQFDHFRDLVHHMRARPTRPVRSAPSVATS
jgi:glycerol kinase